MPTEEPSAIIWNAGSTITRATADSATDTSYTPDHIAYSIARVGGSTKSAGSSAYCAKDNRY